jgi:hypothetical protein
MAKYQHTFYIGMGGAHFNDGCMIRRLLPINRC